MIYENYFSGAFCYTPTLQDFRQGQTELVLYNPAAQPCRCTLTAYFTAKPPCELPAITVQPETNALLVMPDVNREIFADCGFWGGKIISDSPLMINVVDGPVQQDPQKPMYRGGCTNCHGTQLHTEWRFPDGLWLEWMKLFGGDANKAPFPFNECELYYFLNPHPFDVDLEVTLQYQHLPHVTQLILLPAKRLYVWDNFEKVEFVKNYALQAVATAPITITAVRQLYGLHGVQEWGKVIHCAMVGIPGPVPQD